MRCDSRTLAGNRFFSNLNDYLLPFAQKVGNCRRTGPAFATITTAIAASVTTAIAADITKYSDNRRRILFVVYDPSHLVTDEQGFSEPILKREGMLIHFLR